MAGITEPYDLVDPLIDTAKPRIRWVFSVFTARPFGLVRLGPNTDPVGTWDAGYRYNSSKISCFSHLHAWQLAGVPVMPISGELKGPGGYDEYASEFNHGTEIALPGYYAVTLENYDLRVELTATNRAGFHRYRFPASKKRFVLFDLGAPLGPAEMSDTYFRRISETEIAGYSENATTPRRSKRCKVYFAAKFNVPFTSWGGWHGKEVYHEVNDISGSDRGAFLDFSDSGTDEVLLKIGVSYVSIENARANLDAEIPHWRFGLIRAQSRQDWNRWLGKVRIEGGIERHRKKFYTDLWRCLVGGQTMSDVDGSVSDLTGDAQVARKVPLGPDGRPKYPHISLQDGIWNGQWSLNLVYALIYPRTMSHVCNSLVDMYRYGGLIPRGPTGGSYSFVMISAPSTPFIVSAYMKGIRDFDVVTAYEGMKKNAFPGGLMSKAGYEFSTCLGGGIEYYIDRGYIPEEREAPGAIHVDGAAQTLEYAYQDWCLAQLATLLGHDEDKALFASRSENYSNLFDPATGFMRPRNLDGSWVDPFDPLALLGFCEANSWQYTWYVPHNLPRLIELMGGSESFIKKLDQGFRMAETMDYYAPKPDLERDKASVNYGNEPGRYVAHLFNHAGAPWLAQKWARAVKERTFSSVEPEGFCEDDDNGKAAATSLLLALGLFDLRGGADIDPGYEITTPVFDRITIQLDSTYFCGREFVIETIKNSKDNLYIQKASLNGAPLEGPWILHQDVVNGGRLVIEAGPAPNKAWGTRHRGHPA